MAFRFHTVLMALPIVAAGVATAEQQVDEWGRPILDSKGTPLEYVSAPDSQSFLRNAISPAPRSPALVYDWGWGTLGNDIGRNLLEIADVDGDGDKELVISGGGRGFGPTSAVFVLETDLSQISCLLDTIEVLDSYIAQLDTDPALEIILAAPPSLLVIDGATCNLETESAFPAGTIAVGIGDAENDGTPEVVFSDGTDLFVAQYDNLAGANIRRGFGGNMIRVGELGRAGGDDIGVRGAVLYLLNGTDLSPISELSINASGFDFGDLDGDGTAEVIWFDSREVWSSDIQTRQSTLLLSDWADVVRTVDIDGDGNDEVLVGNNQWGDISIVDGDGTVIHSINNPSHGTSGLFADDFDEDGVVDIFWGAGHSSTGSDHLYRGTSLSSDPTWMSADLDGPFQLSMAQDFDSQAPAEMAISIAETGSGRDIGGVAVVNAATGAEIDRFQIMEFAPWGTITAVASGNIDDDPNTEICFTGDNTNDEFATCVEYPSGQTEWIRPLPRGFAYHLALADFDDDNSVEMLLVNTTGTLALHDAATGFLEWTSEDLWDGNISWGYDDVIRTNDEIWAVGPDAVLYRLSAFNGDTLGTIPSITQIAMLGTRVIASAASAGVGYLHEQTHEIATIIPHEGPVTSLEGSPDGTALLISTGSWPDLEHTFVPLGTGGPPVDLGSIRTWDTQLENDSRLLVANDHGVVRWTVVPDAILRNGFE